jgi:rod shape-determining protein MreD
VRALYVPIALAAQVTIAPLLSIFGVQPSILLAVFVLYAFRSGPLASIWMGFGCGLLLDTYASGAAGAFALSLSLIGFIVGQLHERRVHVGYLLRVVVLGIATLVHDAVWHMVSRHGGDSLAGFVAKVSLPGALYTMLVGAVLFAVRPARQARNW